MTPSLLATKFQKFLKNNFQTTPLKAAPFFFGTLTVIFAFFGLLSNHSLVQSSYGAFGFLGGNGSLDEIVNSAWLTLAAIFAPLTVASVISYFFGNACKYGGFLKFLSEGKIKEYIIVCGLGVKVVLQAIKQTSFYNCKKVKVTIIDANDSSNKQFYEKFRIVLSVCELEFWQADMQSKKPKTSSKNFATHTLS